MALPPISSDLATRSITLAGLNPASEEVRLKTIHEIFDWLRSIASSPEEKRLIDAEEAAFMKTYGDGFTLPEEGLTVKKLIAWALYGSSPFDPSAEGAPSGEAQGAMKAILHQHVVRMKSKTLDRILYLLRVLNRDKMELDGRYKPSVEPAVMDVKSYHADYNDRTAYRIEHGRS